jgi:hypothetical protein
MGFIVAGAITSMASKRHQTLLEQTVKSETELVEAASGTILKTK